MLKQFGATFILAAAVALGLSGESPAVHAGGGCHQIANGFEDAATTTISIAECKFVPAVVRVQPGDAIEWTNNDPVDHTVTGVAGSWGDSKIYQQGKSVSYTFAEPGVFPYFCDLHPGMVGAVVVGDDAAASADPGAGVLAVSDGAAAAGAQAAAPAQDGSEDDGFGPPAIAFSALAATLIAGALLLAGLRLSGRLPRA